MSRRKHKLGAPKLDVWAADDDDFETSASRTRAEARLESKREKLYETSDMFGTLGPDNESKEGPDLSVPRQRRRSSGNERAGRGLVSNIQDSDDDDDEHDSTLDDDEPAHEPQMYDVANFDNIDEVAYNDVAEAPSRHVKMDEQDAERALEFENADLNDRDSASIDEVRRRRLERQQEKEARKQAKKMAKAKAKADRKNASSSKAVDSSNAVPSSGFAARIGAGDSVLADIYASKNDDANNKEVEAIMLQTISQDHYNSDDDVMLTAHQTGGIIAVLDEENDPDRDINNVLLSSGSSTRSRSDMFAKDEIKQRHIVQQLLNELYGEFAETSKAPRSLRKYFDFECERLAVALRFLVEEKDLYGKFSELESALVDSQTDDVVEYSSRSRPSSRGATPGLDADNQTFYVNYASTRGSLLAATSHQTGLDLANVDADNVDAAMTPRSSRAGLGSGGVGGKRSKDSGVPSVALRSRSFTNFDDFDEDNDAKTAADVDGKHDADDDADFAGGNDDDDDIAFPRGAFRNPGHDSRGRNARGANRSHTLQSGREFVGASALRADMQPDIAGGSLGRFRLRHSKSASRLSKNPRSLKAKAISKPSVASRSVVANKNVDDTVFGDLDIELHQNLILAEQLRLRHIWEDCELSKDDPFVNPFENACYAKLMSRILHKCKKVDADEHEGGFFHRLQNLVVHLRSAEVDPQSYHHGGFLYKIDNLLAVLMYRRKLGGQVAAVSSKGDKAEKESMEQQKVRKERQALVSTLVNFFGTNKRKAVMIFGLLTVGLLGFGIIIISAAWYDTARTSLDSGIFFLNQANEGRVRVRATELFYQPQSIEATVKGDYALYQNLTTNPAAKWQALQPQIDRYLVETLNLFDVESVYVSSEAGHFTAAFRNGKLNKVNATTRLNVITIVSLATDSLGNANNSACLDVYAYNTTSHTRLATKSSTIDCSTSGGFDPRTRPWYLQAKSTQNADFTRVYNFSTVTPQTVAQSLGISYAFPLTDTSNAFSGVFGIDIRMSDISNLLREVNVYGSGIVMMMDNNWNVIASSSDDLDSNKAVEARDPANALPSITAFGDATAALSFRFRSVYDPLTNSARNEALRRAFDNNEHALEDTYREIRYLLAPVFSPFSVLAKVGYTAPNEVLAQWTMAIVVPEEDFLGIITTNAGMTLFLGACCCGLMFILTTISTKLIVVEDDPSSKSKKDNGFEPSLSEHTDLKQSSSMVGHPGNVSDPDPMSISSLHMGADEDNFLPVTPRSRGSRGSRGMSATARFRQRASSSSLKRQRTVRVSTGKVVDVKMVARGHRTVAVLFVLVLFSFLCIWIWWQNTISNEVSLVTSALKYEYELRTRDEMLGFMAQPSQLMKLEVQHAERGMLTEYPGGTNEKYDRYLSQMARLFIGKGEQPFANFVYVAFPDGKFAGAKIYNATQSNPGSPNYGVLYNGSTSTGDYGVQFSVLDSDSGNCFKSYASQPAAAGADKSYSLVRDTSKQLYMSPCCLYNATSTAWYKQAVAAKGLIWTRPYVLDHSDNEIGLTVAHPMYNSVSGELEAVFGADISIDFLSTYTAAIERGEDKIKEINNVTAITFFLDRTTVDLVASSATADRAAFDKEGVFNATRAVNDDTRSTAHFLLTYYGDLRRVITEEIFARPLEDPITSVFPLEECCGLDYIYVVNLPFEEFFGAFADRETLSFIVCSGIVFIVIYIVASSFVQFRVSVLDKNQLKKWKLASADNIEELSGSTVSLQVLSALMRRIRKPVIEATAQAWRRKVHASGSSQEPVEFNSVQRHYSEQAVDHINNARANRNILTMCSLQCYGQALDQPYAASSDSQLPIRMYNLFTSHVYHMVLHLVILIHICLVFVEPDTFEEQREDGTNGLVLLVEFGCLVIELTDIIINFLVKYYWGSPNFLQSSSQKNVDSWYFVLFVAVAFDFALSFLVPISFEYLFPLRPLILVMRNESIRAAAVNFMSTIYYARYVFLLYMCIVVVAASMGTLLFGRIINTQGPESSFRNFIRSLTTSFVYISTGENYPDIVYPTFEQSPFYVLYFVIFSLIGMFFVLAMVIGMFQDGFHQAQLKKRKHDQMISRVGTVAAFILMDLDGSDELSIFEFEDFLLTLRPNLRPGVAKAVFEKANKNSDGFVDVAEFVNGIDEIIWHRLVLEKDYIVLPKWRLFLRYVIFERPWYQQFVMIMVLCNLWLVSLYGVVEDEARLDAFAAALLFFYSLEMIVRVVAYGFDEFWNYSKYNGTKSSGAPDLDPALLRADDEDHDAATKPATQLGRHGYAKQPARPKMYMRQRSLAPVMGRAGAPETGGGDDEDIEQLAVLGAAATAELPKIGDEDDLDVKQFQNIDNVYITYANRFDLVLITFSAFAYLFSRIKSQSIGFDDEDASLRFVLSFPLLRVFSAVKRTRHLVFTVITLMPAFASVFSLMFVIFFLYAVLGVWMFEGKFDILQDSAPAGNFDTMSDALLTLFQMLVGESWHVIMYAAIRSTRGFGASWYFIAFISTVTLLFVNVFIGIVLTAFRKIFTMNRRKEKLDKLKLMAQELKQQALLDEHREREAAAAARAATVAQANAETEMETDTSEN
jgi:Ion transport protein/Methyl-accepting chemotaxis protein-like, first PDC sensor domain